jgi:zinc transport system substrate-binding protein
MSRARLAGLSLAVIAPLLAACSTPGEDEVVASFYPLQFVAERVVGEHLTVGTLTAPGVEPHELELTVRQTASLAAAKVVLYEQGLQPSVDEAVVDSGADRVLDVTDVVHLRHVGDEGEHDHGNLDPHFWLDPTLMAEVTEAFADEVAEADPAHEGDYRRNADELVAELDRLDREWRRGLAQCRIRTVVVSHDAFGYLGARYDLDVVSISGLTPDVEPSPKRLAEIGKVARDAGVTTIFTEELASPALANTLAGDLGLETAVLNPLEGLTDADDDADYFSLMRDNLAALRKANDCR